MTWLISLRDLNALHSSTIYKVDNYLVVNLQDAVVTNAENDLMQ